MGLKEDRVNQKKHKHVSKELNLFSSAVYVTREQYNTITNKKFYVI